jgi:hypothetical protein
MGKYQIHCGFGGEKKSLLSLLESYPHLLGFQPII